MKIPIVSSAGAEGSAVYCSLLEWVRSGRVGATDRLVDTAIAADLGVSRMPVREALLRLVHEGYLVGTTRGFMLPQLEAADIANIFEVRRLLEPRAACAAVQVMDEFAFATLRAAHGKAVRAVAANDPLALIEANTRFRQVWLAAVPNKRLAATIARFVDHVQIIRNGTLYDQQTHEVVLTLLTGLLHAFESGDVLRVHDAMVRFVDRGEERFFALLGAAADAAARAG